MLGYYPFSLRDLMSWRPRGRGDDRERVGHTDVVVAQAKAREWLDEGVQSAQRRWRLDAWNLALSGAMPALGLLLFGWSPRAMFATFVVDLAVAWFWDAARMKLRSHACEHELRRVLAVERALVIARAARRRTGKDIVIRRDPELDTPLARFAMGYGLLAFAALCVMGAPLVFLVRDAILGAWPQPLWLVFIPAAVRSAIAIAEIRGADDARPAHPELLPQALAPSFAVLFSWLGMAAAAFGMAKLDLQAPAFMQAAMYILAYAVTATAIAWLLAAQVRHARGVLGWFVERDATTLAERPHGKWDRKTGRR